MIRLVAAVVVATAAALPRPAMTQEVPCDPSESVEACYQMGYHGDQVREVGDRTAAATTGPQTTEGAAATSIQDFLPRVGLALLTPGVSEGHDRLALNLNRRAAGVAWQLGAQLNEPTLFEPLLDALPETGRADAEARLERRLRDRHDIGLSVSLTPESRVLGRSFRPHRAEIAALVGGVLGTSLDEDEEARRELGRLLLRTPPAPDAAERPACRVSNRADWPLDCFREPGRDELAGAAHRWGRIVAEGEEAARIRMEAAELQELSALLGNQPQVVVSVSGRVRNELVGPDELTGTLRYEHGFHNLNWLRRQLRDRCGDEDRGECYTRLIGEHRDRIGRAHRLSFTADWAIIGQYELILPDDGVEIIADRTWELKGTAGYGQYFGRLEEGTRRPRFDLDVSYAFQGAGSLREDRLEARGVLTLPLTEQFAGAFGAVWANRPEYRGEVQHEIGATAGLTYKFASPE